MSPQGLQQRLGTAVYEACRTGALNLPQFPNFEPLVKALRQDATSTPELSLKVTVAKHDKLYILRSLARRWMENESTKESAHQAVQEHNTRFDVDVEDDERTGLL